MKPAKKGSGNKPLLNPSTKRSRKTVFRELERLEDETQDLFAGVTGYLMEMEKGIEFAANQHDEDYDAVVNGDLKEWFLDDEWWGDRDPDQSHLIEHRKTYEILLPRLLRYSVIILTATIAERQIRLMGRILGGLFNDEMKTIPSARNVLRSSARYADVARDNRDGLELLGRLNEVRNCIVHAHGFVGEMNPKHQAGLRNFVTAKKSWHGLSLGAECELVSSEFQFGQHRTNFTMWLHQETKIAVLKLIRAIRDSSPPSTRMKELRSSGPAS